MPALRVLQQLMQQPTGKAAVVGKTLGLQLGMLVLTCCCHPLAVDPTSAAHGCSHPCPPPPTGTYGQVRLVLQAAACMVWWWAARCHAMHGSWAVALFSCRCHLLLLVAAVALSTPQGAMVIGPGAMALCLAQHAARHAVQPHQALGHGDTLLVSCGQ